MKKKIGIAIIIIGTLHTCLGMFRFHRDFSAMIMEGLISTGYSLERGLAFWFTFAGILMITLGVAVRAIESQDGKIPMSLGWIILLCSIVGASVFPVSGFWLMLIVSLLILFSGKAIGSDQTKK